MDPHLWVAKKGASEPVMTPLHSPSRCRQRLAVPTACLLDAPWACVMNICRAPHLELAPGKGQSLATSRAPFLRVSGKPGQGFCVGAFEISLSLSPHPFTPTGTTNS